MGAASEEGLDGKSGGPLATDLEAPLRRRTLAMPARAPLCPAGKGQVGGRQAFLCSPPGLDRALSRLRLPRKATDRTCFLTLLIAMLESVLSPTVPAKGLTWRPRLLLPFLLTGYPGPSEDRKVAPRTQAGGGRLSSPSSAGT